MKKLLLVLAPVILASCASQGGWTPTVDTYQQPQYQYQQPQYQQQYYPQGQNRVIPPQSQQYYQQTNPYQPDLNRAMVECRQLAQQSIGGGGTAGNTAIGALGGAALGAAGGAIIGAFTGSAGTGAALGAATGGVAGGAYKGIESEDAYKRAYSNCLRNRGFRVVQ